MRLILILMLSWGIVLPLSAQKNTKTKVYWQRYSFPSILSFANVQDSNTTIGTTPRYTIFPNNEYDFNVDFGKYVGLFSGVGTRNIGFISQENGVKIKRRTITLNVPLAIKLGNIYNWYVYGGAGFDLALYYRRKTFLDSGKQTYNKIASDETPFFLPSAFAGFNYKCFDLKFEYFLNNFVNQGSKSAVMGNTNYYKNYTAQIFFVSLGIRGDFTKYFKDKFMKDLPKIAPPPKEKKETNV